MEINLFWFGSGHGDFLILKSLSKKFYKRTDLVNIYLKAKTTKEHFKWNLQYLKMKFWTGTWNLVIVATHLETVNTLLE